MKSTIARLATLCHSITKYYSYSSLITCWIARCLVSRLCLVVTWAHWYRHNRPRPTAADNRSIPRERLKIVSDEWYLHSISKGINYLPIAAKRYFSWFDFSRSEKSRNSWQLCILQRKLKYFHNTYHIDELNESQSEGNLHLLCHVLHRSNELIVSSKKVTDQPLLLLRA